MSAGSLLDGGCGCDEGARVPTPVPVENPPGRSMLAYRIGTHSSFKATMQTALSRQAALGGLTTRKDDDPSIALLDAWATVLDVLTFYQERIANEGFVRTAVERRSEAEKISVFVPLYGGVGVCIIAALVWNRLSQRNRSAASAARQVEALNGREETSCQGDQGQETGRQESCPGEEIGSS